MRRLIRFAQRAIFSTSQIAYGRRIHRLIEKNSANRRTEPNAFLQRKREE
jgi:hypothetical protein